MLCAFEPNAIKTRSKFKNHALTQNVGNKCMDFAVNQHKKFVQWLWFDYSSDPSTPAPPDLGTWQAYCIGKTKVFFEKTSYKYSYGCIDDSIGFVCNNTNNVPSYLTIRFDDLSDIMFTCEMQEPLISDFRSVNVEHHIRATYGNSFLLLYFPKDFVENAKI